MIKRANNCGGFCTVFKHDSLNFFPEIHVIVQGVVAWTISGGTESSEISLLKIFIRVLKMNKRLAGLERHEGE